MDRGRHTTSARDRPANLCLDTHTYSCVPLALKQHTDKATYLLLSSNILDGNVSHEQL